MTKSTKKKLQRFLVVVSRFLGTAVIIGVILVLIPLVLPRLQGYQTYDVVSGSMEPEIPIGSLILVKPIDPLEVKENDIIAFYSEATVVCHRVVYNNTFEGKYTTKGDANADVDLTETKYDQLIGIVEHHYPFLGMVGSYIDSASGKLLIGELIVIGLLLHIVSSRIRI